MLITECFNIDGYYALFRCNVAEAQSLSMSVADCLLTCGRVLRQFQLLWVRLQDKQQPIFIGAIYHPPKPL